MSATIKVCCTGRILCLSKSTFCSNTLERLIGIKIKVRWLYSFNFITLLPTTTKKKREKSIKEVLHRSQSHNYAFTAESTFPVVIRPDCAIQRLTSMLSMAIWPFFLAMTSKHSLNAVRHCRECLHRKKTQTKELGNSLSSCPIAHTVLYKKKSE